MQDLDAYDRQLLRLLQKNNQRSAQELGSEINLSASAVQRRLQRLRAEKVIEADVSIVSPAAANIGLTCIVDVNLHEDGLKAIQTFMKALHDATEVSQCYYVTGSYDLVLIVNTQDMSEYEAFTKKHFMDNSNVKSFYTHVVMSRLKVDYAINV